MHYPSIAGCVSETDVRNWHSVNVSSAPAADVRRRMRWGRAQVARSQHRPCAGFRRTSGLPATATLPGCRGVHGDPSWDARPMKRDLRASADARARWQKQANCNQNCTGRFSAAAMSVRSRDGFCLIAMPPCRHEVGATIRRLRARRVRPQCARSMHPTRPGEHGLNPTGLDSVGQQVNAVDAYFCALAGVVSGPLA
jgi:hypothetical protein